MELVLVRHAGVDLDRRGRFDVDQFEQLLRSYDRAPLDGSSLPSPPVAEAVSRCRVCICSDLRRAVDSGSLIVRESKVRVDPSFAEIPLPTFRLGLARLPYRTWSMLFRSLWFLGYAGGVESIEQARGRATRCAARLAELAEAKGSVAVIGHRLMNYFIAGQLLADGWRGPRVPVRDHWDLACYRSQVPEKSLDWWSGAYASNGQLFDNVG